MLPPKELVRNYRLFPLLHLYIFNKVMGGGDWPYVLMKKLVDPKQISPRWAVGFCLSAKEIGLDICNKQEDLYKFVTEHEIYKTNNVKYRKGFNEILHKSYEEFEAELIKDVASPWHRNIILNRFKKEYDERIQRAAAKAAAKAAVALEAKAETKLDTGTVIEKKVVQVKKPEVKKPEVKKPQIPIVTKKAPHVNKPKLTYSTNPSAPSSSRVWRNPNSLIEASNTSNTAIIKRKNNSTGEPVIVRKNT